MNVPSNSKLIALDELCGTKIAPRSGIDRLIKDTGIDFDVEKVPACSPEGAQISTRQWVRDPGTKRWEEKKIPLYYILRRKDNKHVLGMVKKRYHSIPLDAMLEPFHQMVDEYNATYETAGVIAGGAKIWVAARLPHNIKLRNRKDDMSQVRIMLLLDQSGLRRNAFFTLMKRIYCNNQFHVIALAARRSGTSVKHSKNWAQYLELARANFQQSIDDAAQFEQVANDLDDRTMTTKEMIYFAGLLLPNRREDEEAATRTALRRERLNELFTKGAGNLGQTRWDAFSAVTEFCDHKSASGRMNAEHVQVRQAARERHMVSNLLGGPGDIFKHRALRILQSNSASLLKVHKASLAVGMHVEMN